MAPICLEFGRSEARHWFCPALTLHMARRVDPILDAGAYEKKWNVEIGTRL
jgi:hypothetical protein